jgi:predicted lipoprotein
VTATRRRRLVTMAVWILAPAAVLAIVRPWTIRPIESHKPAVFEPESFATSAWPRLAREAAQSATDVSEVVLSAGAAAAKPRFVKGTGEVMGIDRRSRVGVVHVRVGGATPATVAIQVGPVFRGTALRDASTFIHFSDFTNQFDYAGAANALNDHALRTVIAPLQIESLQGRTVTFTGAVGKSAPREDGAIEIVPVSLEVVGAAAK